MVPAWDTAVISTEVFLGDLQSAQLIPQNLKCFCLNDSFLCKYDFSMCDQKHLLRVSKVLLSHAVNSFYWFLLSVV